MENRIMDWKDIASTYYDKCLTLTILILLFTFLVFPKIDTKSIRVQTKELTGVILTAEEPEKIVLPVVDKPIVIFDPTEDKDLDQEDYIEIPTIDPTNNVLNSVTSSEPATQKLWFFDDSPVISKQVQPVYPEIEKRLKIQGTVVLDIEILANGNVGAIEIFKSISPGLDQAAITALQQWKFQPAKTNGKAVTVWVRYPISFNLTK